MWLSRHTRDITKFKVIAFGNYDRINYSCRTFKHALKENIVLKRERIRIAAAGKEAFRATAIRPKFGTFSCQKFAVQNVNPWSTIHVDSLSTHYRINIVSINNQLIRLRNLAEEAFGVTLPYLSLQT